MRALLAALVILLGRPPAQAAPLSPAPVIDRFRISAEVRGVVRHDLQSIGKGALRYLPLPAGRFRVQGNARVEHKEKRRIYQFAIDMTFALDGRRLTVAAANNRFNTDAAEFRNEVERVVPFVYLARALPIPGPGEEPVRTWRAPHGYFVMRYVPMSAADGTARVEVRLYQDDAAICRVILEERGVGPHLVHRIAIPARTNVALNFDRAAAE